MTQACHNCRRQRLKCDRSVPQCLKCLKRGQVCLGYQRLLRWGQGVASRGKMAGWTYEKMGRKRGEQPELFCPQSPSSSSTSSQPSCDELLPMRPLKDPLVQDINYSARKYLSYCELPRLSIQALMLIHCHMIVASDVCRDLVLYDMPQHNPFRELVPLTWQHPILLQIIIANSALHMSNTRQKPSRLDSTAPSVTPLNDHEHESYRHALAAKQRAIHLLKSALASVTSVDIDVTLATVLLFIEFELLDSGRDNWKHHINGARTLIERLCGSNVLMQCTMSPLRRCLISNCLVFDIVGSALACTNDTTTAEPISTDMLSLLQDAEGNNCASFPTVLLQLLQAGTGLLYPEDFSSPVCSSNCLKRQQDLFLLLHAAQSFDPLDWATSVQPRSPTADLLHRTRVASAHQAAVCIYLSRVLLSLYPSTQLIDDLESLVAEVVLHLSSIHQYDPLFTATTWPAFIAGAETSDPATQEWVARRFREMWQVEPWGTIRSALEVLEQIWAERNNEVFEHWEDTPRTGKEGDGDWVRTLRRRGVDWLII